MKTDIRFLIFTLLVMVTIAFSAFQYGRYSTPMHEIRFEIELKQPGQSVVQPEGVKEIY